VNVDAKQAGFGSAANVHEHEMEAHEEVATMIYKITQ